MIEASRNRTRLVGLGLSALFVVLAGKAGYLALSPAGAGAHRLGDWAPATPQVVAGKCVA